MRSSSLTTTSDKVTSYCVSDERLNCSAQAHPARGGVHEKQVDGFGCVTGAGQHDKPVGRRGEGHVALFPIESVFRALAASPRLHTAGREPVLGLQPGRSEDGLARGDPPQPLLFLGAAPGGSEDAPAHDCADEVRRRSQRTAELLVECDALDEGHRRTPVLFGEEQSDEIELAQLDPQRRWVPDGVVLHRAHHLERTVPPEDVTHRLAQQLLLLVEIKI